jgi:hypothetical protein
MDAELVDLVGSDGSIVPKRVTEDQARLKMSHTTSLMSRK